MLSSQIQTLATSIAFITAANCAVAGDVLSGFNRSNSAPGLNAVVAGGSANLASGQYGIVPGGQSNTAGSRALAAGTRAKAAHAGAFVWADSRDADFRSTASNQFLVRASGGVGINTNNPGGNALLVNGPAKINGNLTVTSINGLTSFVGPPGPQGPAGPEGPPGKGVGGIDPQVQGSGAFVGGGSSNSASASFAMVGGGGLNSAAGKFSMVLGGQMNRAKEPYSFAAGRRAIAKHQGAFVWADSQNADFASFANNSFSVRALGGFKFTSGRDRSFQTISWTPGSGSVSFTSDSASKEHFSDVDPRDILRRLASLQIKEWSYIGYTNLRHVGPTAQAWHAAFPLNDDDKTINTTDLHGISLAAIQGLFEELKVRDALYAKELDARDQAIEDLKSELENISKRLDSGTLPPR